MGWLESLRRIVSPPPDAPDPEDVARLHAEVARLYERGLYREAEAAARQLVGLHALGEDHPDYATALGNLALLLQKRGDLDGAEPLLRQALAIRGEVLGGHHPDYATSLSGLAELLQARGDLVGAEPMLRQALAIRWEALGERHPHYASALGNLALLLQHRGDLVGAEPMLRRALKVRMDVLGEGHPDSATAMHNLALLLCDQGLWSDAEPMLCRALHIREEALGAGHPDARSSAEALAALRSRGAAPPDPVVAESPAPPASTDRQTTGPAEVPDAGPAGPDGRALEAELAALGDRFASVGEALRRAADLMLSSGLAPPLDALQDAADCHRDLERIGTQTARLAESLSVAAPGANPSLLDLCNCLAAVIGAEHERGRREDIRRRATLPLDRVLGIAHREEETFAPLRRLQDEARDLLRAIAEAPEELPTEAGPLVDGTHPLVSFLAMIDRPEALCDEAWAALHAVVADSFGRALAVAAARGRLVADRPPGDVPDARQASGA